MRSINQSVRRYFPTIGLATVYNTLRTMTERGLVAELPFASAMRFDANMTPHANLVGRKCDRIEDLEFAPDHLDTLLQHVKQAADFAPDGQRIDVASRAVCPGTGPSRPSVGRGRTRAVWSRFSART
jgi:Fe2+ or Zn2+ uptake regulation protein